MARVYLHVYVDVYADVRVNMYTCMQAAFHRCHNPKHSCRSNDCSSKDSGGRPSMKNLKPTFLALSVLNVLEPQIQPLIVKVLNPKSLEAITVKSSALDPRSYQWRYHL